MASTYFNILTYKNDQIIADLENYPNDFDEIWHVTYLSDSKNFFLLTFCPILPVKVKGHTLETPAFGNLAVFGTLRHQFLLVIFPEICDQVRKLGIYKKCLLTPPSNSHLTRVINDTKTA